MHERSSAGLLHMPAGTLRRWLAGSGSPADAREGDTVPLVRREDSELVALGLLTFTELIELLFIRQLRLAGVPLCVIRSITRQAVLDLQTAHPFADRRFYADQPPRPAPTGPHPQPPSPSVVDREVTPGVVAAVIEASARQLDCTDNRVCRYWPLGKNRRVVLDPARAFGQPTDPASGVPTRVLYGACSAGEPVEEVTQWYGVDAQAVRDAIEFHEELAGTRVTPAA